MAQQQDWIDEIYEAWEREFPAADTAALKTITRLARLGVLLESFQTDVLAPLGLVMSDFTVLAALRRLGPEYQSSPSELYNVLERSSGGMTKMIKRLERLGLVKRLPDPADGRSSLVRLTRKGLEVHEHAFDAFLEASHDLLGEMSPSKLKNLDRSLQSMVSAFEGYFYR
jgi:DNA-binding MarR family transcriptional regulator